MNPMLKSTFKYAVPVGLVVGLALAAALSDPADINDSFAGVVGLMAVGPTEGGPGG